MRLSLADPTNRLMKGLSDLLGIQAQISAMLSLQMNETLVRDSEGKPRFITADVVEDILTELGRAVE